MLYFPLYHFFMPPFGAGIFYATVDTSVLLIAYFLALISGSIEKLC